MGSKSQISRTMQKCLMGWLLIGAAALSLEQFDGDHKRALRDKSLEMFRHAYDNYMTHAYPADELMPLRRGSEQFINSGKHCI